MKLLMTFRILIETTKIAWELKNTFEISIWWKAVDVNENSHILHLKFASYMHVIEADDASDGLQDFNRNDKNCIWINKHFWKFYIMESCWSKGKRQNLWILHSKLVQKAIYRYRCIFSLVFVNTNINNTATCIFWCCRHMYHLSLMLPT